MAEPAVAMRMRTSQLLWRAARTTIMMSVMPGMGRGTKEESTMETRKRPKRPKLKRKCISGRSVDGCAGARTRWQLRLRESAMMATAADGCHAG